MRSVVLFNTWPDAPPLDVPAADGARDPHAVIRELAAAISSPKVSAMLEVMESRLASSGGAAVCAHVYANAGESIGSDDLVARINAAAASRFGEGKVTLSARMLQVEASKKAFDMDALRAFD